MLCDICYFQGDNVAKYSQHIRDILAYSKNGDLRNGMKLYSILNDDLLNSLYDNIPYLNTTIYKNDAANFFDFARGFITGIVIDSVNEKILFDIRLEIPWAESSDMATIYTLHQIGFVLNDTCQELVLPRFVAKSGDMMYAISSSTRMLDNAMSLLTTADIEPLCLGNDRSSACETRHVNCDPYQAYFEQGILVATTRGVSKVSRSGMKTLLNVNTGSLYIPWANVSHVDIEGISSPYRGTFFAPGKAGEYYFDENSDEGIFHRLTFNKNESQEIEKEIISKTKEQENIIKTMLPDEAHYGVWSTIFVMIIVLVVVYFLVECRICPWQIPRATPV